MAQKKFPKATLNEQADIRILIQNWVEDLRFAKRQQWQVAYFLILIDAGAIGFWKLASTESESSKEFLRSFLMLGTGAAAAFGTIFLCSFHMWIQKCRIGLNTIYSNYSTSPFKFAVLSVREGRILPINENFFKDWEVATGSFLVEHAAGFLVWYFLKAPPAAFMGGVMILAVIESCIFIEYSMKNFGIKHHPG